MSARRPPVQNFVQIRPLGASRQMDEIQRKFFLFTGWAKNWICLSVDNSAMVSGSGRKTRDFL